MSDLHIDTASTSGELFRCKIKKLLRLSTSDQDWKQRGTQGPHTLIVVDVISSYQVKLCDGATGKIILNANIERRIGYGQSFQIPNEDANGKRPKFTLMWLARDCSGCTQLNKVSPFLLYFLTWDNFADFFALMQQGCSLPTPVHASIATPSVDINDGMQGAFNFENAATSASGKEGNTNTVGTGGNADIVEDSAAIEGKYSNFTSSPATNN